MMVLDPLRVVISDPTERLDPSSRINLAKMFPIEMNVRVMEIGHLDDGSLFRLLRYIRGPAFFPRILEKELQSHDNTTEF